MRKFMADVQVASSVRRVPGMKKPRIAAIRGLDDRNFQGVGRKSMIGSI
jgi:hypothetical protein